jgi:bifunctional non-homologous end joining protein LigD
MVRYASFVNLRPIRPMLASAASRLPTGPQWSYEVKFDGYRTLAFKDGSRVKLLSRDLKDATKLYPSVARAVARLRAETALLDGEVVAVDEDGHPSFQALHHQSAHTRRLVATRNSVRAPKDRSTASSRCAAR